MPIEYWNPTPIYFKDYDIKFLDAVKEIKSKESEIDKLYQSNSWGDNVESTFNSCKNIVTSLQMFHLQKFIFDNTFNFLNELNFVTDNIKLNSSWFNKIFTHGFQGLHAHDKASIAGVFYFEENLNDNTGISFHWEGPNEFSKAHVDYNYKPGRIILFPGNLYHRVKFKKTEGIRKSFSFNIFLEKL